MRREFGFVLAVGVVALGPSAGSAGAATTPEWAASTRRAAAALAGMDVATGQEAACQAVAEFDGGEADPRLPILLYNKGLAMTCCGPVRTEACGAATDAGEGFLLLERAAALAEKHGGAREPEYAPLLWHLTMQRVAQANPGPGGPGWRPGGRATSQGCAVCPEIARTAAVLEAVAPAFAAETKWDPADPDFGIRREAPAGPGSWLAAETPGRVWPRAYLLTQFLYAPLISRRLFPAFALERLAGAYDRLGFPARQADLAARAARLREVALGREHPLVVEGWLRFARATADHDAAAAARRLRDTTRQLAVRLGDPRHVDLLPFYLELYRLETRAGDGPAAARALAEAGAAAKAAIEGGEESTRLRSFLAGNRDRPGIEFGDGARARYWELVGGPSPARSPTRPRESARLGPPARARRDRAR